MALSIRGRILLGTAAALSLDFGVVAQQHEGELPDSLQARSG